MAELRRLEKSGDQKGAADLCARLLEDDPRFMPAHRWRIDQLLGAGKTQEALALAREVQHRFPDMRAMAVTKQAVALDRLGQPGAAMRVLMELHDDGAQDVPASGLLGNFLLRDGSLDRAEHLFQAIRAQDPGHPGALRGLIDIAIKRGKAQAGLALCDEADKRQGQPDSLVRIRRAQCLDLLGKGTEAIALLTRLADAGQDSVQSQMLRGGLQWKAGDLDGAKQVFAALLAKRPDHMEAAQSYIAVLGQMEEFDAAIAACDAAIAYLEQVPESFYVSRAQALLAVGRPEDAVASLEQALAQTRASGALHLELANACVHAGLLEQAEAAFQAGYHCKATRVAALLGLVRVAQLRGRHTQVVVLLRTAVAFLDPPDPTVHLALCEALIRAGDPGEIEMLLRQLVDSEVSFSDEQIEQMFNLAERQTLPAIACRLIDIVTGRAALSLGLARRLLRLAHITADPEVLRQVAAALGAKLPAAQRTEFRIEATALTEGPAAAVAVARRVLANQSSAGSAFIIGRHLIEAGQTHLAMRYLRCAVRQMPGHKGLNAFYVHVCGVAGHHAVGHAHLDAMEARNSGLDVERERLMLIYAEGATQAVLERAIRRRDSGLPGLLPRQFLDLCLACGDLDLSLATLRDMRSDPRSTGRMAASFTTGLHGRMLTDLQVYRTLEAKKSARGAAFEDIQAELADQYYHPARKIIDRWITAAANTTHRRATPVPKRIFQYWDSATVPDDVAALVAGWQNVPDFEHVLLSRTRALTLLRRQFGARVVTAFQRARHVTEESDLLRLCLIFKFGGIYSDADDRVTGDIAALAGLGSGLVVTREPIGAIANNTLIAPPGNPILGIALKMTVRALVSRDADGAWFKSGPGMLTRAAAVYLRDADPQEAQTQLSVLDGNRLRQFIQPHIRLPYKKTVKYWNTQDKDVSQKVLASLTSLGRQDA